MRAAKSKVLQLTITLKNVQKGEICSILSITASYFYPNSELKIKHCHNYDIFIPQIKSYLKSTLVLCELSLKNWIFQ